MARALAAMTYGNRPLSDWHNRSRAQVFDRDAVMTQIGDVLHQRDNFILTTHRDPDGDGLGAEAAVAEALQQLGKQGRVINDEPLPEHYRLLDANSSFEVLDPKLHAETIAQAGAVILLDASYPERADRVAPYIADNPGTRTVIDHHPGGGWAHVELIDTGACATTALVTELIDRLVIPVTPSMADALYCGIVTDTLGFRIEQTSAETHRLAARLIETGASVARVHNALFRLLLVGSTTVARPVSTDGTDGCRWSTGVGSR